MTRSFTHQALPSPPAHNAARTSRTPLRVGLIGGRGYVGGELLPLLADHPGCELAFASSRSAAGQPLRSVCAHDALTGTFVDSNLTVAALEADVFVLALPNGEAARYVDAIDAAHGTGALISDTSADHRFDDAWTYGLAELNTDAIAASRRIANPGCYATAMMLALAPIAQQLTGQPCIFGISGYSGAGTQPNPRNDIEALRDNIIPYHLADHVHEREVSRHLQHPVRFLPHVAPFFRGISITVSAVLNEPVTVAELTDLYTQHYAAHPLITITGDVVPAVRDAAHQHGACIGGFAVAQHDARQIALVATLDNLLKGAASQVVQNINLACGFAPLEGLAS